MGYTYRKRTVNEMLSGRLEEVYDFAELDGKLDRGEISQEEWNRIFSEKRHLIPHCIGGSDVSVIFGHNPWKLPSLLSKQIMFPESVKEKHSPETIHAFARGHAHESGVAKYSEVLMNEDENSVKARLGADKIIVRPFTVQVRNMAFPNCVGNFDAEIEVVGGPHEGLWLGEIKTTINHGKHGYWPEYFNRDELPDIERIPPAYLDQIDFYMGILPYVKGTILMAACGFSDEQYVQLIVPRNDKRSCHVLNAAQRFCEEAANGYAADDSPVEEPEAYKNAMRVLHGELDASLPPADLSEDPYMGRLESVMGKIADIKKVISEPKRAMEEDVRDLQNSFAQTFADELSALNYLERELDSIKYHLGMSIGDSVTGEGIRNGKKYTVQVKEEPSFAKATKEYFKKKYPDVYKDVSNFAMNYDVKVSVSEYEEQSSKEQSDETDEEKMLPVDSEGHQVIAF